MSIIETDLEVEFAEPKDYVAPGKAAASARSAVGGAGAAAGGAGFGTAASSSSGGSASSSAKSGGVVIIDDDDEKRVPGTGAWAAAGAGASVSSSGSGSGPALSIHKPAFEGGVGTVAGGPSPAPGATPQSLAALAALRRAASAGSAAAASKFAKEPAVKAFTGVGYKAGDGTPVSVAASAGGAASGAGAVGSAGASAPGLVGVRESKGGEAGDGLPARSPSLTPSVSAGGVVLSAGARPSSAKARTLNKFEQAKAAKAFAGEGKTLRD